jgi:hypothetical protein
MKKVSFFAFFLILTFSVSARDIQNRFLFIEGTAENETFLEFFHSIFTIEAAGAGYIVTETREEAAYTFRFFVFPNNITDDNKYILRISLIDNLAEKKEIADTHCCDFYFASIDDSVIWYFEGEEILFFNFYFSDLDEINDYSQLLFHRATVFIPPARRGIIDTDWQNKWIYLRASFDYPVVFYALQPKGLIAGQAVYGGTFESPTNLIPLDHTILPQPGITLGIEVQFLNFMSAELNFMLNMGDPSTNFFLNIASGIQLKYIFKTSYFMIQPYGAFLFHLNKSPVFDKFPSHAFGGGIQVGVRGGRNGAFFIDSSFMYSPEDVYMHNSYDPLSPSPSSIKYRRFVFGIGVGYKYGFFNRM